MHKHFLNVIKVKVKQITVTVPRVSVILTYSKRYMTTAINSTPETIAPHRSSKTSAAVLGIGDKIGEGDSYLVEDVLPPELAEVVFEKLMKEVAWNIMHHRGSLALLSYHPHHTRKTHNVSPPGGEVPRLVAVQGEIDASGK